VLLLRTCAEKARKQHPTMFGASCFGLHRKSKLNSFAGKDSISFDGRSRTFGSGDNPDSRLHGCPYSFKQLAANGFMWIPREGFPHMTVCASCGKRVGRWSKRQLPWYGLRGPLPLPLFSSFPLESSALGALLWA
jgi:hypothetical protein